MQPGLHELSIVDCPIAVLAAVATAAGTGVTVENVTPERAVDRWFESAQSVAPEGPIAQRLIRNARFDVALDNAEFLSLLDFWDRHGVYAVFTERSPIAFSASRLPEAARYRALANFGFVAEFVLGGPSGDGTSRLVTPRAELIAAANARLVAQ